MIKTRRFTSGDLEIRELEMTEEGDSVPAHEHFFPHTSIIFSGAFSVTVKGKGGQVMARTVSAGEHLLIEAEDLHAIECVKPGKVWCTFCSIAPKEGARLPQVTGWESICDERIKVEG